MVLLVNLLLGELVFGGLGTGLYSMVMAAAIAVFLAGLMVGRTPEYLGKKIGLAENEMIMLYALAAPLVILPLTAIAIISKYPPAEPGALVCEPLKAAMRGR